jgi:hypothetical protein
MKQHSGRVCTTDKEESMATGKEYLSPSFYIRMKQIRKTKIVRCEYCRRVLPPKPQDGKQDKYCDIWCRSGGNLYKANKKKYAKESI